MKIATRIPLAGAALLLLLATSAAAAGIQSGNGARPNVPAALAVSAEFQVKVFFSAVGVQIYRCQASSQTASPFAWTLVGPEAKLLDQAGSVAGHHYAGPTWEANDGSKVKGTVAARSPSPDSTAISWLLLNATALTPGETFDKIGYVQRLNTKGGTAPAAGCNAESVDKEVRIPYSAEYYFYAPR